MVKTQGLLWFRDLSAYDPYFVLPIISAILSYMSIVRSPSMKNTSMSIPMLTNMIPYVK